MNHIIKCEVILPDCSNKFENGNVNGSDLHIKVIKTETLDGESADFNIDPLDILEMSISKDVLSMENETNSILLRSPIDGGDFDVVVVKTKMLDDESSDFNGDPLNVQETIENETNSILIKASPAASPEDGMESDAYKYFLPDEEEISLTCDRALSGPKYSLDHLFCNFCSKQLLHIQKCERKYLCSNELGAINYKCSQCNYATSKAFKLRAHVVIHINDRQFPCKMYQRTFKRRAHYDHLLKTHDKQKAKEFSCQDCGNSYYDKISLKRHVKDRHSGLSDQKYNCPHCPYAGLLERNLKLHMVKHSGEGKRYKCVCNVLERNSHSSHVHMYTNKNDNILENGTHESSSCGTQSTYSVE